jgi:hypothetical protein
MYLRIIGDQLVGKLFEEIANITNGATLYCNKVYYDKEKRTVSLPIRRYKTKIKKFLWLIPGITFDKNIEILSTIVIRNVDDCQIETHELDEHNFEIDLLFGLQIESNTIWFTSAAESTSDEHRGEECYTMNIKISKIDIEIFDQGESVP